MPEGSANESAVKGGRRVLVAGGRDYSERSVMTTCLRKYLEDGDVVVHGGASGADALAGDVAGRVLGHRVEVYPADWQLHGKSAGPIRNQQMLDAGVDFAVIFPGGRGTADMLRRLRSAAVPYVEIP